MFASGTSRDLFIWSFITNLTSQCSVSVLLLSSSIPLIFSPERFFFRFIRHCCLRVLCGWQRRKIAAQFYILASPRKLFLHPKPRNESFLYIYIERVAKTLNVDGLRQRRERRQVHMETRKGWSNDNFFISAISREKITKELRDKFCRFRRERWAPALSW